MTHVKHSVHCCPGYDQYKTESFQGPDYTSSVSSPTADVHRQYMEVVLPSECCSRSSFSLLRGRLAQGERQDDCDLPAIFTLLIDCSE